MTDVKRVGDSGVYTSEGNVAGSRAAKLTAEREKQRQEYEDQKSKLKEKHSTDISRINDKFSSASDTAEQEFRKRTVGLVTAEAFRRAREEGEQKVEEEQSKKEQAQRQVDEEAKRLAERAQKRRKMAASLSFGDDDDEDTEEIRPVKRRMKDPSVDTSFLPDVDRERELAQRRDDLRREWLAQQEVVQNEALEVVYSFWDGSGHRKSIEIKKSFTIGKFLDLVKQQLLQEFKQLRSTSHEDLLYVKEDLIIPHHISFYDLIVTKARGKSGPLFHFDVHEDVRLVGDVTVEKDESHPGKVVERKWYERNKHIFPASRWEIYDPSKAHDRYTVHGEH